MTGIPTTFTTTATTVLSRLTRSVQLVYTPHDHWPLPPNHHHPNHTLRISVLDSSFNPPTLAHLALATAPSAPASDARLLLLSTTNADKTPKLGDASPLQRLHMMYLFAQDIDPFTHNVAIAIIDEPTFVGKSTALLAFLRPRLVALTLPPPPTPTLSFLLGTDTLQRIFAPRYYPSEDAMLAALRFFFDVDNNCLVCARRDPASYPPSNGPPPTAEGIPLAATPFLRSDKISLIDIGPEEQAYSSSLVRQGRGSLSGEWRKLVSERVARYLVENHMYGLD